MDEKERNPSSLGRDRREVLCSCLTRRSPTAKRPERRAQTQCIWGPDDEALLAELLHEVTALRGYAPTHAAVFRALLRLMRDFDGALLARLVEWIDRNDQQKTSPGQESERPRGALC